jgi:cytochrome bd ubiquinol oxidase subunit I
MDSFFNPVMLSRLQFAVTTLFHMLWPLIGIGLALLIVIMEALWLKTDNPLYYRHTRFWSRLYLLTFGVGVASGLPLEFQFGTNWANFSKTSGGYFGNILGFEAAMAFMLEAAFLGIMLFAWDKVSRVMHFFATVMVALGASVSAFWIMAASSWMQVPAGVKFENGRAVINDYFAAVFNPALFYSFTHMWVACLETTLFFVAGISAWGILKNRFPDFFLKSFKMSLALAIIFAPIQIYLGDLSTRKIQQYQPAKAAAVESHWQTNKDGDGASFALVAWPDTQKEQNKWEIKIPYLLSLLSTHTLTGKVTGLSEFLPPDRPPIVLIFYSFRIMVLIGLFLMFLSLWGLWKWYKGHLREQNFLQYRLFWLAWIFSIPLGFLASDLGWIVREVGRQPWVIYNVMRTSSGASNLTAPTVAVSFLAYCMVYLALFILFIVFTVRMISKGPDMNSQPPLMRGTK